MRIRASPGRINPHARDADEPIAPVQWGPAEAPESIERAGIFKSDLR
jgi:hypothetical protein